MKKCPRCNDGIMIEKFKSTHCIEYHCSNCAWIVCNKRPSRRVSSPRRNRHAKLER